MDGTPPTARQVKHWEATFSEAWEGQRHSGDAPVAGGPARGRPLVDVVLETLKGGATG